MIRLLQLGVGRGGIHTGGFGGRTGLQVQLREFDRVRQGRICRLCALGGGRDQSLQIHQQLGFHVRRHGGDVGAGRLGDVVVEEVLANLLAGDRRNHRRSRLVVPGARGQRHCDQPESDPSHTHGGRLSPIEQDTGALRPPGFTGYLTRYRTVCVAVVPALLRALTVKVLVPDVAVSIHAPSFTVPWHCSMPDGRSPQP